MAKKEKTPPKKPAINSYWLYASIILFFIGMSFFGGSYSMSSDQKINISNFENYKAYTDRAKADWQDWLGAQKAEAA